MAKYADIAPFYEWLDWLEKESNTSCPEYQTLMFYEIRDKLDNLPEVVRCKDCKRFVDNPKACSTYCSKGCKIQYVKPDDFCSHGERKEQ